MSTKNFAAMTIKQCLDLRSKGVNIGELFQAYADQYKEALDKTNMWIDFYGYNGNNIPATLKGNMFKKGKRVTSGCKLLENFYAPFDSTVCKILEEHCFQIIGHTNMDELAMGSHGTLSYFGPTLNPNDPAKKMFDINSILTLPYEKILSPGGSSSGMAVSVSSGLSLCSMGSDTGGSVRVPAEYCGICSFKPTFGNISRYGIMELSSTLDTVGVTAKTVECLQYIMDMFFAHEDTKDSVNQIVLRPYKLKKKVATLNHIAQRIIGAPAYQAYLKAQQQLKDRGYIVEDVEINDDLLQINDLLYSLICYSDAKSSTGVLNGLVYSAKLGETGDICDRIYKTPRTEGMGFEPKRRSIIGQLLSGPEHAHYIDKARYIIQDLLTKLQEILKNYDCILTPVTGYTSYIYAPYESTGKKDALTSDIWLSFANLCNMPAGTVPICHDPTGFYSVQVIAEIGNDKLVLEIMQEIYTTSNFNERYRGNFEYIDDGKMLFSRSN